MSKFGQFKEALNIFEKYVGEKSYCGFSCEHDVMYVCGPVFEEVSEKDRKRLDELGFFRDDIDGDGFMSFRWGS